MPNTIEKETQELVTDYYNQFNSGLITFQEFYNCVVNLGVNRILANQRGLSLAELRTFGPRD